MLKSKMVLELVVASGVVWTLQSGAVAAQSADTVPTAPPSFALPFWPWASGLWTVTVGAQAALKPGFEGAKQYNVGASPIFSFHRAGSADPPATFIRGQEVNAEPAVPGWRMAVDRIFP